MNCMPRCLSRSIVLAAQCVVCSVACSIVCCSAAVVRADEPTTAPTTVPATQSSASDSLKKLDKLLAALSSDDWKQRQQAADGLAQLDPILLPRLREAVDATSDSDLRNALLGAMKQIEERTKVGASLVSLNVKDAPAVEVLKSLGAQLSFDLVADNTEWLNDVRVTVSADRQPFWTVMKSLSPQWPVRVATPTSDPTRITLQGVGTNYLNERAAVAGPFLICPVSMQSNGSADLLPAVPVIKFRMISLQLMVLSEPKLHASRITVSIAEALDENGKTLSLPDAGGRMMMGMSAVSPAAMTSVRLSPPADAGKKIAKLTGTIACRIPTRTKHIELADFADGKKHPIDLGGRQVDVTVFSHDKLYDVKLAMPQNINPQDELALSQSRDMTLLDAAGHPLFRRSFAQAMNGRNWEITVTFAQEGTAIGRSDSVAGEAAKLVWELPVEFKEVQTPFELTNIPLAP